MWDLVAGKTAMELTHHKRSVRALASHPLECTFLSGGADNVIKRWKHPEGIFLHNYDLASTHSMKTIEDGNPNGTLSSISPNNIVNALAVNEDNCLVAGCDNGVLQIFDHSDGRHLQTLSAPPQPGSLACEASILAASFDRSGYRLFTGEGDKTIKVWARVDEFI
jgi:pleiotropic regulator 1